MTILFTVPAMYMYIYSRPCSHLAHTRTRLALSRTCRAAPIKHNLGKRQPSWRRHGGAGGGGQGRLPGQDDIRLPR